MIKTSDGAKILAIEQGLRVSHDCLQQIQQQVNLSCVNNPLLTEALAALFASLKELQDIVKDLPQQDGELLSTQLETETPALSRPV